MFIIAFYWVLFIVLYLSGLFVFVAAHMKENMKDESEEKPTKDESKDESEEKPTKDESKDEPEEKPSTPQKRVADTPKRALRKVKSEYNLRSRKKNVSKEKPAKD